MKGGGRKLRDDFINIKGRGQLLKWMGLILGILFIAGVSLKGFLLWIGSVEKKEVNQNPVNANPVNGVIDPVTGMEFVFVKGGCFQMGNIFGYSNGCERPVQKICLDDFYIGKFEVTQKQWKKVMKINPSRFIDDEYPVEMVSWRDTQNFIRKLNQLSGKNYRLPTEAEWEYAARSGGKYHRFAGGANRRDLHLYANICDQLCPVEKWRTNQDDGYENTAPVGSYRPNDLGIYDMTGNVSEWVQDALGELEEKNPRVALEPSSRTFKIHRGGSWGDSPICIGTTSIDFNSADYRMDNIGFRLVLPIGKGN